MVLAGCVTPISALVPALIRKRHVFDMSSNHSSFCHTVQLSSSSILPFPSPALEIKPTQTKIKIKCEPKMDYKAAIHKFSTKPPGYEAARQRENQRRHRARVKCRITDLEANLEATQTRLDEALKRIEQLTAEVQRLQATTQSSQEPSKQPDLVGHASSIPEPAASCGGGCKSTENACPSQEVLPLSSDAIADPVSHGLNSAVASDLFEARSSTLPSSPFQPVDTSPPELSSDQPTISNNPNDDCNLLPPPSPGESTIRCREAYSMLKERVMADFDPELATEWLKPGFRRAVCPGDGCRVQTHVLFAFVDHITSG